MTDEELDRAYDERKTAQEGILAMEAKGEKQYAREGWKRAGDNYHKITELEGELFKLRGEKDALVLQLSEEKAKVAMRDRRIEELHKKLDIATEAWAGALKVQEERDCSLRLIEGYQKRIVELRVSSSLEVQKMLDYIEGTPTEKRKDEERQEGGDRWLPGDEIEEELDG